MFGYIKPFKPEMKVIEFDIYKSVYCGLCKSLGEEFSFFSRMTLSYDYAFVALFKMSLPDSKFCGFRNESCMVNPLKKKMCCNRNEDIEFVSNIAMLMFYYKLKDNITDSGFWGKLKSYMLLPFASHARKKAAVRFPNIDAAIKECILSQNTLEHQNISSIDIAADPTAKALSTIFAEFTDNESLKPALSRFGYLLGRWVYIIDALDDLEDDIKNKNYNPFINADTIDIPSIRENATNVLNLTVGELTNAFVLIDFINFKPILDNIIYLGLPHMLKMINNPQRSKKNDRSI